MALSKANKAIFRAKYGEQMYEAMIAAENVIVTDEGVEKSLADIIATLALKTEIPTDNNALTNGAGYQTASDVASAIRAKNSSRTTYKPSAMAAAIQAIETAPFAMAVVSAPAAGTVTVTNSSGTEISVKYQTGRDRGYIIPSAGTYTASCTYNSETKSESFTIASGGGVAVRLKFAGLVRSTPTALSAAALELQNLLAMPTENDDDPDAE